MNDNVRRYYMNDIGGIIMDAPPIIQEEFSRIMNDRVSLNNNSRYHIGQVVRVSDNVIAIRDLLTPVHTFREATLIARSLANQLVNIISVDRLTDDHGVMGTYYTIEDEFNCMYALPENLISDFDTTRRRYN